MNGGYDRTNASTQQSGSHDGNGPSTTEKIKDMAGEYVNKAREAASDVASSAKNVASKAAEWVKETTENLTSSSSTDKSGDTGKGNAGRTGDSTKKSY